MLAIGRFGALVEEGGSTSLFNHVELGIDIIWSAAGICNEGWADVAARTQKLPRTVVRLTRVSGVAID